jgi:N-sulfoglucosamine sulfohydrolase
MGNTLWDLYPSERHLASLLSAAGYRTELIGVHHESRVRPDDEVAERLGFDRVQTGGRASEVADRAIAALRRHADRQEAFYLQVGFFEPHRQRSVDESSVHEGFIGDYIEPDRERGITMPGYLHDDEPGREEIAELQGAVRYMDAAAGRVLAELDRLGLRGDTIVVFTTDHGLALPRAKFSLYDPGLEVALTFQSPRLGWMGGRVVDTMVSNIDVVPTLLEAVGIPIPDSVQGRSLTAALEGSAHVPRDRVFGEQTYATYYDPRRCVRTVSHKLIVNFGLPLAFLDSSGSWKPRATPRKLPRDVTRRRTSPNVNLPKSGPMTSRAASASQMELYDLRIDPLELTNRIDDPEQRDHLEELRRDLRDWMRDTDDPLLCGAVTPPMHRVGLQFLDAKA